MLKLAAVDVPLVIPLAPVELPANKVTTRDEVIFLISLFAASATYKLPVVASTEIAFGPKKLAELPVALILPLAPVFVPANKVTAAADVICLIWLLPLSATKKVPELLMVIPAGNLNLADVPVLLARPALPDVLPAKVVTVPYTLAGTTPPALAGVNAAIGAPTT